MHFFHTYYTFRPLSYQPFSYIAFKISFVKACGDGDIAKVREALALHKDRIANARRAVSSE